jgi:hypothetical protein
VGTSLAFGNHRSGLSVRARVLAAVVTLASAPTPYSERSLLLGPLILPGASCYEVGAPGSDDGCIPPGFDAGCV